LDGRGETASVMKSKKKPGRKKVKKIKVTEGDQPGRQGKTEKQLDREADCERG